MCVCVCVCVFGIHVFKIAVERWFWEVYMVFGSLVELHVGLHLCLCFLLLEKLLLKTSLTPPQHLLDTLLSVELLKCFYFLFFILSQSWQLLNTWWINRENSCLLDSFSTAGGSIELLFLHLMGCSSTPPRYLYLSKTISSIPSFTAVSIPLNTFICWDLLRVYLSFLMQSDPHFVRSLSW